MSNPSSSTPNDAAVMVMDRFVSASSSQDAVESLDQMVQGFQNSDWQPSWILDHDELPRHLVWLLQHGTLKNNEVPCEEGIGTVCQLYQHLAVHKQALQLPTPGVLLESLLDVLDHHQQQGDQQQQHPVYVRVLALKVLEELSKQHKSTSMQQWLQAPNGLHRLSDILSIDVDALPLEEAVRDQALQVAKLLAKEAPLAKVFLFSEVECKLLDICWRNGGMTHGKPIVIDALQLVVELLKHADASLQDLVWQRPTVPPRLMQLIDLRGGEEFRHPELRKGKNNATAATKKNQSTSMAEEEDDDDDDLDNLLASGSSKKKSKGAKDDEDTNGNEEIDDLPKLTESEEKVVALALQVFRQLMDAESLRPSIWKQNYPLFELIWDMGRVQPISPPLYALPSSSLQQEALSLTAERINDPQLMNSANRLDSLLAIVCTGGAIAKSFDDKLATSQAALAVLRHTLSGDAIHSILMRTLAPPPMEESDGPPPGPTVVQKLWSTVQLELKGEHIETRTILLTGAFGGLGLMLCDEQSREIMYKLALISMDELLESVFSETEEIVQCSMLRFLCEWTFQCPLVAHNLLRSPSSTHLAGMATAPSSHRSLVQLLLGLTMESLTKEEDCGGWTRAGILQIITKIGISKFTSSLEGLKTNKQDSKMPWMVSEMEFKSWKKFCSDAVLIVRKRVVEELAGGSGEDSDQDDLHEGGPGGESTANQAIKPLRKLVSQQAKEMVELRQQLEEAQAKVVMQEGQLETWKRRMESTPTDLDNMLNEFQNKTAKLEETVRVLESRVSTVTTEKDNAVKKLESKLSESQQEIEKLCKQEQDARDDLERTEQEMQALSQAYSNLEIEYQRSQGGGAPTGEASQQHGGSPGSLEVATLRAENDRLRSNAKAADEWMKDAVEKLNEFAASNVDLQKQVASLHSQLEQSRASSQQETQHFQTMHEDRLKLDSENQQLKQYIDDANRQVHTHLASIAQLEQQLAESDSELADLRGLRKLLESEKQRSAQLEECVAAADEKLSDLRGLRKVLESEKQRSAQLEAMVSDSQRDDSQLQLLKEALEQEKQRSAGLQQRLSELGQEGGRDDGDQVTALRAEYDLIIANKNAEIISLKESLSSMKEEVTHLDDKTLIEQIEIANKQVEEVKMKSQHDIYQLESVVRELKDRLGSGLGPYTVEDIRTRDEEIDDLRKANEAAQNWMAKAVEHQQMTVTQIAKLTEEKNALALELNELRNQTSGGEESILDVLQQQLLDKGKELGLLKEKYDDAQVEYERLKKEMEANQGLLDDLGIAMEDVGIMQQKLRDSEAARKELEDRINEDVANEEIETLQQVNAELESRVNDLQNWTDMAQTKISEIIAFKDALQTELDAALLEKENLSAALEDSARDNEAEIDALNKTIEELEIAKQSLEQEVENQKLKLEDLSHEVRGLREANSDLTLNLEKSREGQNSESSMEPPMADMAETTSTEREEETVMMDRSMEDLRMKVDELKTANQDLAAAEAVIQNLKDRILELEGEVAGQQQLLEQACVQTSKLQQRCEAAERKAAEVEAMLAETAEEKEKIEEKLNALKETVVANETEQTLIPMVPEQDSRKVDELTAELVAERQLSADSAQNWEVIKSELEATVQSLQAQMQEQEEAANEAIDQWQDACVAAEERCTALEQELEARKESQHVTTEEDLDSNEAAQNALRESLSSKERDLEISIQAYESSKALILELKEQIATLEESLDRKEDEAASIIASLTEHLQTAEEKFRNAQSAILSKDGELEKGEARVSELRSEISSLQQQLSTQYSESQNSIKLLQERMQAYKAEQSTQDMESLRQQIASQELNWKEKLGKSESENDDLKRRLQQLDVQLRELHELRETVSQDEEIVRQWESRASDLSQTVATLEQKVESLQSDLAQQEHDAVNAIAVWEENFSDLEAKYANLETEVLHFNESISCRDWSIEQLKANNEGLTLRVEELMTTAQIRSSMEEDLIQGSTEISRLTEVLENERQIRISEREKIEAELASERGKHAEARDEIETLTYLLEENKTESETLINHWTAKCEELNESLADAQAQLKQQEDDANAAITIWECKADELENDLDIAEEQLTRMRMILNADAAEIDLCTIVESKLDAASQYQAKFEKAERDLSLAKKRISELSSQCESLAETEKKSRAQMKQLEEDYERKVAEMSRQIQSKSKEKLEEERDRLTVVITQLEEELREANEMIQACITDDTGDKATEAAAQALREQMQELNVRMFESRRMFEAEKSAKELAMLEVERLREDVAALVSLSEEEGSDKKLETLTTQAIEKVQKKERAEIDEMKRALFRAMDDLDAARSAERTSIEKLSKVRLQLTMYEQEIIAAKSEVSFLTQAIEELRETEESKRASLEYRMGSLEHENDVVRKYHAAELESVRNELSQITMDRDRILQQLKETEKTNASLVYAGSKEDIMTEEDDLQSRCAKLRIENAHLLTMAADDKARAERRLREMLAAQAASNEADVILQSELRVSAEAAVETLKVELAALRNERDSWAERSNDAHREAATAQIEELKFAKKSILNLKTENQDLKEKLKQISREAQSKLDSMTDECRTAQAKLHKMNQDGRFEALVQAEKSKMLRQSQSPERRNLSQNGNGWIIGLDDSFGTGEIEGPSLSSAEAFDLIQKQKKEIAEERLIYREFLQEHDSLLALLAQLDGEKTALVEALGAAAADEAIQKARRDTSVEIVDSY